MIFKQFRFEPLSQASYLLGCYREGVAFIVDPIQDLGPEFYFREAEAFGLRVVGVLETHLHADFLSCARALSRACWCPHFLHGDAEVHFPFTALEDGQVLVLGHVLVRVIHTPGHTPEHVCYLITDVTRADEPWAVLTGDALLVGDVGRPDLLLGEQAAEDTHPTLRVMAQYRSIRDRIFTLPDHVEVYPAHYGWSACGGINMSGKAASTIYFEKKYNLPMRQPNQEIFAEFVRDTSKPLPDDFRELKRMNMGISQGPETEGSGE